MTLYEDSDSVTIFIQAYTSEQDALTLSRATEQYCAAGTILKPLCLPKPI